MRHIIILLLAATGFGFAATAWAADKKPIELFNGRDLSGWEYYLVDPDVKMAQVWNVKDGVLTCQGEPMGYLATKKTFKNFKLTVEWRWPPGTKPGNSGVLMRITGKPMALPKCVEAQLQSGNAGDIWAFQGFRVQGSAKRFRDVQHKTLGHLVGVAKIRGNENPPGQWNRYQITLIGDKLTLVVNGKKVNEATGVDEVAGKIGLQSEGGKIQFRTVRLVPLDD